MYIYISKHVHFRLLEKLYCKECIWPQKVVSLQKGILSGQSWLRFDGFIYKIFKKSFSIKYYTDTK